MLDPKYNKFWVALSIVIGSIVAAMAPTPQEPAFVVTMNEWYMILVTTVGAVGVRQISNKGE